MLWRGEKSVPLLEGEPWFPSHWACSLAIILTWLFYVVIRTSIRVSTTMRQLEAICPHVLVCMNMQRRLGKDYFWHAPVFISAYCNYFQNMAQQNVSIWRKPALNVVYAPVFWYSSSASITSWLAKLSPRSQKWKPCQQDAGSSQQKSSKLLL
jgi:hypothetical protein